MAITATTRALPTPRPRAPREHTYAWEGRDRTGKVVRGEVRASGPTVVQTSLRRQGIADTKVTKRRYKKGRRIGEKDITLFTRQLATMMKAGVPLLQSFDIVARGTNNASVSKLFTDIRGDVETGTSLSQAFRKYPLYFDSLFCNLVGAGEQAGILDDLLDRLASYKEKMLAIKGKIKSALFYPAAVLVVAFIVVAVIMLFVVPAFKEVFSNFGADLPAPTLMVIAMSDFFVEYWYLVFGGIGGGLYFLIQSWRRSPKVQMAMDRLLLKLPVFGPVVEKGTIARWLRTLSTMFAAGVPLVEALDSVGGASGNPVVFGSLTPALCTVSGNTVTMLAVGTCTLTADQAGNANFEPAAQVTLDVVLAPAPAPDLAVSIDDGRDYVQYGKPLSYTIVVSNVGNTSVTAASVSALLPAILQGQGWSCVASSGSACGQASGSGDLVDSGAALAVGGSLTYVLDTVVVDDQQLASDEILLSAGVTASGDVNGANDSATDLTLAVLFRNGFEQGEDGAQALPPELRLGAVGTLTQDLALTLAVDAATLVPWQRTTLAQAGDGAFQVEAIRVADGVYLRLRSAEQAGAWSRLDAGAVALVLVDTRLGLVGAGAGPELVLPHAGPFEVVYRAAR